MLYFGHQMRALWLLFLGSGISSLQRFHVRNMVSLAIGFYLKEKKRCFIQIIALG